MHTRSTTRELRGGRLVKRDSLVKVKKQPAPKPTPESPIQQQHKIASEHLKYLHFLSAISKQMKTRDELLNCPGFRQVQKTLRLNLLQLYDTLNACLLLSLKNKDDPMLYERQYKFELVYRRIFLHPFPPHVKTPFQKGLAKFWNRGLNLLRLAFLANDYNQCLRLMHGLYSFIINLDLNQDVLSNELMFDLSS